MSPTPRVDKRTQSHTDSNGEGEAVAAARGQQ